MTPDAHSNPDTQPGPPALHLQGLHHCQWTRGNSTTVDWRKGIRVQSQCKAGSIVYDPVESV